MKIDIEPDDLWPGVTNATRIVEMNGKVGIVIDLRSSDHEGEQGRLTLWFNSPSDVHSWTNRLVSAVRNGVRPR